VVCCWDRSLLFGAIIYRETEKKVLRGNMLSNMDRCGDSIKVKRAR
jgi:hypothetical protein